MDSNDFATFRGLRTAGLHKMAGALEGVDELGLKEAVSILGRKAYLRRKEAAQVVAGIGALAELRNEKVADWGVLLRRALMPALASAGLATLPDLMADGPLDTDKALQHALIGGALGGVGSGIHTLALSKQQNPTAWNSLMGTAAHLPRVG